MNQYHICELMSLLGTTNEYRKVYLPPGIVVIILLKYSDCLISAIIFEIISTHQMNISFNALLILTYISRPSPSIVPTGGNFILCLFLQTRYENIHHDDTSSVRICVCPHVWWFQLKNHWSRTIKISRYNEHYEVTPKCGNLYDRRLDSHQTSIESWKSQMNLSQGTCMGGRII